LTNKYINPFDAQHQSIAFKAYSNGYDDAQTNITMKMRDREAKIKSDAAEDFIQALYLLAQEYGGERFVYTDSTQTELEQLTDEMTSILSRVRTLR